ncbi:MAG TPA: MBL fold metallo-hydrolase [Deltaproteobacteria bacterium]|nr:MBL fold metallo-hydrolase [Deltaproteobacteria bacterium]
MPGTKGAQREAVFGKVQVISGESGCRFPFCTSLLIDDELKALIDPGAGYQRLNELKHEVPIDIVINTHYHYDHIAYNHLFESSRIVINEKEAQCFRNRSSIGSLIGMEEVYGRAWVEGWLERIADPGAEQSPFSPQNNHNWWLSTSRVDGEYKWGDVMDFGKTVMHVIGAPGHSAGFSCMYFPGQGIVYVADLDLTDFGPWYGGSDGDIDLFISSCETIAGVDAELFITGHEKGILSRKDFRAGLKVFLDVIGRRDEKILSLLSSPLSLEDLVGLGPIYGKRYHEDAWVYMWEFIMVKKHVRRMVVRGEVIEENGRFVAAR